MKQFYILVLISFFDYRDEKTSNFPYIEVLSTHENYSSCDKKIVDTHDYFLAKDIRRKSTKQRKPKFIYDTKKNKILIYKNQGVNYFASCKKASLKNIF